MEQNKIKKKTSEYLACSGARIDLFCFSCMCMYVLGFPKYISVAHGQRSLKNPVLEEGTPCFCMGMRPGKRFSTSAKKLKPLALGLSQLPSLGVQPATPPLRVRAGSLSSCQG